DGVASAGLGRVHVASECFRDHGAAGFASGGRYTDATKEWMQGNLHCEFGIERLEGSRVGGMIYGIEPDFLLDGRVEHGRVVGGIDGAEAGSERADALVAVNLDIENLHGQRVTGLCAFNKERAAQRIVTGRHAERVAGFSDGVAETIEGVGLE